MTASLRAFLSFVVGGMALALVLTGCASAAGTSPAPESTADQNTSDSSYAPRVAWLDATSFVLKTWGDACAPQIGDVIAGDQSLEIVLVDGRTKCAHRCRRPTAPTSDCLPRSTRHVRSR